MTLDADVITWEVSYDNGEVVRERDGVRYAQIDRSRLTSFRLVRPGEVVIETFPPPGASGQNLVYRRRSMFESTGGRSVYFLIGWAPMGPVVVVDPQGATYSVKDAFDPGDALFAPPIPHPREGERFLLDGSLTAS